jgi:NADH-quinone oxidoreductase subunit M
MLTALWAVPAIGGLLISLLPLGHRFGKWTGMLVSLAALLIAAWVAFNFSLGARGYQFVQDFPWIQEYSIRYHLGVDGISLWLLLLNALLGVVAVFATPVRLPGASRFIGLLLLMEGAMAGVFEALDLVVFYVFWEAMLIPAYFLLWIWGEGPRPGWAALKFVLYTLVGSLLMLVGIIVVYFAGHHSFDLPALVNAPTYPALQFGLFFLFAAAFAVKVPVFPLHSWVPDAYTAAPIPFLVTFAGVMGKTGAYGFLRIVLPLFKQPVYWWDWNAVMPALAVAGIIWGGFMALAQTDVKALVAYSSISHMGFIVLGIFTFSAVGQQGAVVQMVNHGLIVPALFLIVGWLAARLGSYERARLVGLAPAMPLLAGVFLVVTLAALGLPGLNSFVGEFMILLGTWQVAPVAAVAACVGLILAPVYMLRLFQGAMYGERPAGAEPVRDVGGGELALLAPLLALMFIIGLDPNLLVRALTALGQPQPWH